MPQVRPVRPGHVIADSRKNTSAQSQKALIGFIFGRGSTRLDLFKYGAVQPSEPRQGVGKAACKVPRGEITHLYFRHASSQCHGSAHAQVGIL